MWVISDRDRDAWFWSARRCCFKTLTHSAFSALKTRFLPFFSAHYKHCRISPGIIGKYVSNDIICSHTRFSASCNLSVATVRDLSVAKQNVRNRGDNYHQGCVKVCRVVVKSLADVSFTLLTKYQIVYLEVSTPPAEYTRESVCVCLFLVLCATLW